MARTAAAAWKNRITRSVEVAPEQLLANGKNARIHSTDQQRVMGHVLGNVGWVSRIVVQEGSDLVLDGHMRVALAISKGELTVPVDYVDLSDEEANKVLASFDPIGAMSGQDEELVAELLAAIGDDDEEFLAQIESMSETTFAPKSGKPRRATEAREDAGWDIGVSTPDEMQGTRFAPERYLVIVEVDDQEEQGELVERLVGEGLRARAMAS